jgi:hypothetical protein
VSRVVREHDLCKNLRDIYVCADFERLKVKVPIISFGAEGFSAHRDGRYSSYLIHSHSPFQGLFTSVIA